MDSPIQDTFLQAAQQVSQATPLEIDILFGLSEKLHKSESIIYSDLQNMAPEQYMNFASGASLGNFRQWTQFFYLFRENVGASQLTASQSLVTFAAYASRDLRVAPNQLSLSDRAVDFILLWLV